MSIALRASRFGPLLLPHRAAAPIRVRSTPQPLLHLPHHPKAHSELPPLSEGVVVHSTEPMIVRKSVFVGHALRVRSTRRGVLALEHILSRKKKVPASNRIFAYCFGTTLDSEVENVLLVVVTATFHSVHTGSSSSTRGFLHRLSSGSVLKKATSTSQVAKDALRQAGIEFKVKVPPKQWQHFLQQARLLPSESSHDIDTEEEEEEREMNMGWTDAEVEEMLWYGIKPCYHDEAEALFDALDQNRG